MGHIGQVVFNATEVKQYDSIQRLSSLLKGVNKADYLSFQLAAKGSHGSKNVASFNSTFRFWLLSFFASGKQ